MQREFRVLNVEDKDLELIQREVKRVVDPLAKNILNDGFIVEGFDLITGQDNMVPHKLNRPWKYWHLLGLNANAVVYEGSDQTLRSSFLTLTTTANCRVSLYIAG